MKIIDVENWERKTQFLNFSKYTHPVFSVSVRLDVTDLVLFCKNNGYSFFPAFLFVVSKCSNQIDEMKTRIENGQVVQYDTVHPSYVVLRDDKCIATGTTEFEDNFAEFYAKTKNNVEQIRKDKEVRKFNETIRTDCLYISSLQWIDITTISDPYNFECSEQTSIPRITWGKYVKNSEGKYEMGFNIAAHHGFMDGWHVAQLIVKLEDTLKDVKKFMR